MASESAEAATQQRLLQLLQAGIDSVGGFQATTRALETLPCNGSVEVLAIGKAADAMTRGAIESLGAQLQGGLLITKDGHASDALLAHPLIEVRETAHPVPDERSLAAGEHLVDWLSSRAPETHLLVLISGGASALVEHLIDGWTLAALQAETDRLLATGLAIGEMNQVRRSLSAIKGGKLAGWLGNNRVTQLLISDVPGDRFRDIGSGLLVPDPAAPVDTPAHPGSACWSRIDTHIIASSALALQAVAVAGVQMGLTVQQADGLLDDDVHAACERIAAVLCQPTAQPGLYLWGGETTVALPVSPGRGGRNQYLALLLARRLADEPVTVLVSATDGSDGPTTDAGGLVNGALWQEALDRGLDGMSALQEFDAGNWLEATGALVSTGPTGTNVMDLVMAVRHGRS